MLFSEKVKSFRKREGLSRVKLAEKLGISARAVYNYEVQNSYPGSRERLDTLAQIFGTDGDYLLCEAEICVRLDIDWYPQERMTGEQLIAVINDFFASGKIVDEDKDVLFCAINDVYFASRGIDRHRYSKQRL